MFKVLRYLTFVFGGLLGILLAYGLGQVVELSLSKFVLVSVYSVFAIIFGIIFYLLFPMILKKLTVNFEDVMKKSQKTPTSDIMIAIAGLIVGLIIAFLISLPISNLNFPVIGNLLSATISIFIYVVFGFIGVKVAISKKEEILKFKLFSREKSVKKGTSYPKILDTSVIIDGRIHDIIKTGFLEGPIIIAMFMVKELQYIADSEDPNRRQRGRRGLDILDRIQKEKDIEVRIVDKDYKNIKEVDHKLLKLTEDLHGKLITNDYNLNKVASLQKISILNINELALAIKPIVIQGEKLTVEVINRGKEPEQGLGYLSDGTMIVVEDGKDYIGQTIETTVTSILQTPAGKMIFTRKNLK
ncbi:PIN domain protein [Parvimonas sp. KA00067]|uniref:PIN/TRAM domain-containing protein n=1 Tax=Parvimonas sp. KA00067 TaxID=1588755 RepID=UPI00079683CB|nr:PIN domain-containing protein [Parvimonas sp. KA00067]KXB64471.1 PIN domain protein [Parvimonas sp. KA00067]